MFLLGAQAYDEKYKTASQSSDSWIFRFEIFRNKGPGTVTKKKSLLNPAALRSGAATNGEPNAKKAREQGSNAVAVEMRIFAIGGQNSLCHG